MSNNSRTVNVVRNTTITTICQFLYLILSFICRTIFTKLLGAEYLGINGLFSNILTILSFAELGIGTALVYRMYAPLAAGDTLKITLYLNLYKKIYTIIIAVISIAGIAIIPFMDYLVEAPNVKENVILLYLLYLLDTVISYVYVYKKSLLIADQKNYIVSIFTQIFNVIMNVMQIIGLLLTHNFVLYCLIRSACNLANNIFCSIYVNKKYPYIKTPAEGKLSNTEINGLKTDVKGLLLTKIASVAFSGTDNIFISAFIGLSYVGILSNYTLLLTTVNTVINKIFDSITASIGNLAVSRGNEKTEAVVYKLFFLNTSIYGYLCLGMNFLIGEFVTEIWLSDEYALSNILITLITIELFFRSIHYPLYTTRNALGEFSQHKIMFAGAAVLNIVLDFLLVRPLGISGLYLATIICRGITYIIDVYVVYKVGFQKKVWTYFKLIFKWCIFLIICSLIIGFVLSKITLHGLLGFGLKIIIITIIYLILFLITFRSAPEFAFYVNLFQKVFTRKYDLEG